MKAERLWWEAGLKAIRETPSVSIRIGELGPPSVGLQSCHSEVVSYQSSRQRVKA